MAEANVALEETCSIDYFKSQTVWELDFFCYRHDIPTAGKRKEELIALAYAATVLRHKLPCARTEEEARQIQRDETKTFIEQNRIGVMQVGNGSLGEGLNDNPNETITNLTGRILSPEQMAVLKLGFRYAFAARPSEADLIIMLEAIWDQIEKKKLWKDGFKSQVITALKQFKDSHLGVDHEQFSMDETKIKIIEELLKTCVILEPDKGHGIVILDKKDYNHAIDELFSDESKFKEVPLNDDPTLKQIGTIQDYLNTLLDNDRNEITEDIKDSMRPISGQPGKAFGLPQTHKEYTNIPPFRPLVDTTGTPYYGVASYLSKLLNPLCSNEYTTKDSFDAVDRIRSINKDCLKKGFKFVSFDITSLFTNVPLTKAKDIILDRVFKEKVIPTNLKKSSLKKLVNDVCTKPVFMANNKLYQQIDGVSMGSPLGPVLANIIMTELERSVIKPLMEDGTLAFYTRCEDNTLVLVKPADRPKVLSKLNSFHTDMQFTMDTFPDDNVHFLDIRILPNLETDVYHKETLTGQGVSFTSFEPQSHRIAWATSVVSRYRHICSSAPLFYRKINHLQTILSWNYFPPHIIENVIIETTSTTPAQNQENDTHSHTIVFNVQYVGEEGERILNECISNLKRCLKPSVNIKIMYKRKEMSMLCSTKDSTPRESESHLVYQFICPGCNASYIGKTDRCLADRLGQHARDRDSAIYKHLLHCELYIVIRNLFNMPSGPNYDQIPINVDQHIIFGMVASTNVLRINRNMTELGFLETLYIKKLNPQLNIIKEPKKFILFDYDLVTQLFIPIS